MEDAYLMSLDILAVDKEEMSRTHKLTLRSSAKKTVTFELAMRERADAGSIEPSTVRFQELVLNTISIVNFRRKLLV